MLNPQTGQTKRIDLGYIPRQWQQDCHTALKRFTVLALHRRAGKTELAIMQLIDAALKFQADLGLFIYLAPFLKQAKAITWTRLKKRLEPIVAAGGCEINESELSVCFKHNSAIIRIFGGDNPDAMRGMRIDGAVIDEVAQIKPTVWEDIVQPALSDRKGWALFIGTPNGVNLFSQLFFKAKNLPDWFSALYTVYDTQSLDPVEVERLRRDMTETAFAREYLCDFSASGEDQLLSIAELQDAAKRIYAARAIEYAPRILGVDPARFGDDRASIIKRQGLQAFPPISYRGLDNMQLAARVAALADEWQPDAIFVDAGNGSGVIDRLRSLGYDVIEVHFGGKADDPTYHDKRAEMWCKAAQWAKDGGAIPNHQSLIQDLAGPRYWYDLQNRKQLESKDELKARGLPSPDEGDALALTFASPVEKKTRTVADLETSHFGGFAAKIKREYNPYDAISS